jgi:uncharacterized protein
MTLEPGLGYPSLGFGVGLRGQHFRHILEHRPAVDWFEIISENYLDSEGWPGYVLDWVAERYPVVAHGVSLSIGSTDPLNFDYLAKLKELAARIRAAWISDHLCWTGVLGHNTHDLLPLPLNEDTLVHVVSRIRAVQDFLERRIVLENPSTYLTFASDTMTEWDFLSSMAGEADCGLLLDVNNVYVSSVNHGFDAERYIQAVPADRIVQFHLAGHTNCGTHIVDTHDGHVIGRVWELYRMAARRAPGASTLLEWDAKIPEFGVLHAEVLKARSFAGSAEPIAVDDEDPVVMAGTEALTGAHPPHLVLAERL